MRGRVVAGQDDILEALQQIDVTNDQSGGLNGDDLWEPQVVLKRIHIYKERFYSQTP